MSLHTLQLTKLELRTSPGLAPSDLVAITTRVAASTLQKNAISGMSAVYRGASHWSILLQNAPKRENVSRSCFIIFIIAMNWCSFLSN